jgi:DNA (cytosine-5)-methyltransferase 1
MRPLLLDLFCGAGGAAMGYHRAGFDVIGVDIEPQPDYPFTFHQGDALALLPWLLLRYQPTAIHASPPCQASTPLVALRSRGVSTPEPVNLIPQTRAALIAAGRPYAIENVNTRAAGLIAPTVLCGSMFGLDVYRHRGFETTLPLIGRPAHPRHTRLAMRNGYLPTADRPVMSIHGRNGHHSKAWTRKAAEVMGIPWVTTLNQVCEAIPPAYTEHIGEQLLAHLGSAVAA